MAITWEPVAPASLDELVETVATWQREGLPVQLHPGDLGWHWRFGGDELARALRVWRQDGQVLAVGLVDSGVLRLALAPSAEGDDEAAARLLADLSDPGAGMEIVEARYGTALRTLLHESGWVDDEPWTPLRRDLAEPVEASGLRVEVVDEHNVDARVEVQRASFPSSTFTVGAWRAMAAAPAYRQARCLLGYDAADTAVAAVTVWSAGVGRPGLLEPLGVHRDHRGRGYGTEISVAAAAALQRLGASSATVCTPGSNTAAVAAYASAGFTRLRDVTDFRNPR